MSVKEQKKCNCKSSEKELKKDVLNITLKIKERIKARKKELTNAISQYCADCAFCPATPPPSGSWKICTVDSCSTPCECRDSAGACGYYDPPTYTDCI